MSDNIRILYEYVSEDGASKDFEVLLDRKTLRLLSKPRPSPPKWTELGNHRCENCTLDEARNKHCPIALNLVDIAEAFKDSFSYERVSVRVTTEERVFLKEASIQEGLSPLIGVVMATSGCPVMEHLKPMARFHLPFATIEETVFRMVSMHLMSRYFLNKSGREADFSLDGLAEIYAEVGSVNRDFALRLADAAKRDANINALVNLDCFATLVPLQAESALEEIKRYFSAYLS